MATTIQSKSQTELKAYLEERLRVQFPSASAQEVVCAAEIAMGCRGYILHNELRDRSGQSNQPIVPALASVRDTAIAAAQSIVEPHVKMAAIACAWVSYAASRCADEQHQQSGGTYN